MVAQPKKTAKFHRPNSGTVKQLHVNLSEDDRKDLLFLSNKLGMTASGVVRHLVQKAAGRA